MVRFVELAAAAGQQKCLLRGLEIIEFKRRELEQLEGARHRVVDVLVRQRDVLQHRDKPVLAFEARPTRFESA